jgi:hypothetical protein
VLLSGAAALLVFASGIKTFSRRRAQSRRGGLARKECAQDYAQFGAFMAKF